MKTITATELRTKIPEVVKILKKGESIKLIHRSKIVGEIQPNPILKQQQPENKVQDTNRPKELDKNFEELLKSFRIPLILSDPKIRKEVYRQMLIDKHVKNIS